MAEGQCGKYRIIVRATLYVAVLLLSACANVPFDYPKTPSNAIPPDPASTVGEAVNRWKSEHGDEAGLLGLSSGVNALGARLRMMEVAQRTIDAQYFIIKKDVAGALFAGGLLAAADRGVRVRLLVDDIFSPGVDEPLTLLSTHPNVEVRIFNPLSRSAKYLNYLTDFSRANRRMHNKSFTVDNGLSIVGGRNIGEEYFEIKQDVKFDDYEVFVIGSVVEDISAGFDQFWNSELAVPIEAFQARVDPEDLDRWRETIREEQVDQQNGMYATAVNTQLLEDIRTGKRQPVVATATFVTDSPEKLQSTVGDPDNAVLAVEFVRRMRAASDEIIIVTPYYVPQKRGVELVEELLHKGVRVVVVTNSLASTNHVPVHSGYARYRRRLLQAGAEFYEIRADSTALENEWGHKPEMMTLHSKATTIDRQTIFVGSLNFDPRSFLINSEMGLFIDSAEVGGAFTERLVEELRRVTWKVDLNEQGELRWTYRFDDEHIVSHQEPGASWWRRFQVGLYRLLPIESQL